MTNYGTWFSVFSIPVRGHKATFLPLILVAFVPFFYFNSLLTRNSSGFFFVRLAFP